MNAAKLNQNAPQCQGTLATSK